MKDVMLSIIRHLLTAAGVVLVSRGVVSALVAQEVIGSTVALIGMIWGPVDEYLNAQKVKQLPKLSQEMLK